MLVFDATQWISFEYCKTIAKQIKDKKVIFVANKCDLFSDNLLLYQAFMVQNDYKYYEVSTKTTMGLKPLFKQIQDM